jgi:GT2 family glycosyltransferase
MMDCTYSGYKFVAITVIIVSKGLEMMLRFCLEQLVRSLKQIEPVIQYHIIVVDNASALPYSSLDLSAAGIQVMRADTHVSFSRACNIAAGFKPNDLYLFLNNDVLLHEQAISSMLNLILSGQRIGICGSRLLFPDNTIQHCGVVFGSGDKGPYHCCYKAANHLVSRMDREYQAVTGACMLVKRELWDEVNGMDEVYDFGLEDIDFCLRARQQGWGIICCNKVDSLHFEAMTPGRIERDVPSRKRFMDIWKGRYCIDG